MPLREAGESSRQCWSRTADFADMSEGSLRTFAKQSQELLASVDLRPPSRVLDGPLFRWILVSPATVLRKGALGDANPYPKIRGKLKDRHQGVAFVGEAGALSHQARNALLCFLRCATARLAST